MYDLSSTFGSFLPLAAHPSIDSLNACQLFQPLLYCPSFCLSVSSLWAGIRSSSAIQTPNYISVLCRSRVLFSINGWPYYIRVFMRVIMVGDRGDGKLASISVLLFFTGGAWQSLH